MLHDIYIRGSEREEVPRHKEINETLAKAILRRRRNVALPSWLDYEAERAGVNVSRILQEALIAVLGIKRPL